MTTELVTKESIEALEKTPVETQEDVLISPTAGTTCTWCKQNMFWSNHCKSREEAANCSNYSKRNR